MGYIEYALQHAARFPHHLIALGIAPQYPDENYGWIEKGEKIATHRNKNLFHVRDFIEKPSIDVVGRLHEKGHLWNSMVLVGNVGTFLQHFEILLPDIYEAFFELKSALGTPDETAVLQRIFRMIPSVNFSLAFLERIKRDFYVLEVGDVFWSDWGEEHRIRRDVELLGLKIVSH